MILPGEHCTSSTQCYSGVCDDKAGNICNGVASGNACAHNESCWSDICTAGVCEFRGLGESCDRDDLCLSNVCNGTNQCEAGFVGSHCVSHADCACGNCDTETGLCIQREPGYGCVNDGLCCDDCIEGTCRALFNATCEADTECVNFHCDDNQCTGSYPGTSCNSTQECLTGLTCTSGTCIGLYATDRCNNDFDCNSLSCDKTDGCAAAPGGRPCLQSVDCLSNSCVEDFCESLANGSECTANGACQSNFCLDGYCDERTG